MLFELENISKIYNKKTILNDISFKVEDGLLSIIGPSGVGKTTLLKIIADLETADHGKINYSKKPSNDNPVIIVFQNYLLFPTLSVFENVAFGLRNRKIHKDEIDLRVNEILNSFGVSDKKDFYPAQLSAGQQQRVAIARAMVINPSVLLLDEPFANLDKNLKMGTASFIRETQRKFNITTICVTHDLEEAFAMSDKIGILIDGEIKQFGTPREIYFKPASEEVASFLGPVNKIPNKYFKHFTNYKELDIKKDFVCSRAESITMTKNSESIAYIKGICFIGSLIQYEIQLLDIELKVFSLRNNFHQDDKVSLNLENYF